MSPSFPLNFVETVASQGGIITITGEGFEIPKVNLFTSSGNFGAIEPLPGGNANEFQIVIPEDAPTGPGAVVVVNTGAGYRRSNAVSLAIGATLDIESIKQIDDWIRVTGRGFSPLSVVCLLYTSDAADE